MKPTQYNPSPLEVDFAKTVVALQEDILKKLGNMQLDGIETAYGRDNPNVVFKLIDKDGTKHEIMVKFIQRVLED